MIVLLKDNPDKMQLEHLINWIKSLNLDYNMIKGKKQTILGLIGDTSNLDIDLIKAIDIVLDVKRIQEPYKKASRKFCPEDTIIDVQGKKIGAGNYAIIAGPCSVESREQICSIAEEVKASGATMLRGGAFKPRTSPYSFQGLRDEGIELLLEAK